MAGAGLCTVWPAPSVKGLVRMGSYVASESKTASSCAGSSSKVEAVTLLSEPAEDVLRCPLTGRWRVGAWHQSVDAPRVSCWASMRSAAAAISAIAARCDGTRMRARMSVMVPAEPVRSIDPVREGIRRCKAEHEEWAPAPASDVESSFESSSMLRHESSPGGSEGAALVPISESLAVQKHSAVRTALHGFRRRGPKSNSELERDKFFRTLVPAEVGIIYCPRNRPYFVDRTGMCAAIPLARRALESRTAPRTNSFGVQGVLCKKAQEVQTSNCKHYYFCEFSLF